MEYICKTYIEYVATTYICEPEDTIVMGKEVWQRILKNPDDLLPIECKYKQIATEEP